MIEALLLGGGVALQAFGASKERAANKKVARLQAEVSRKSLAIGNSIAAQEQAQIDEQYKASVITSNLTREQEQIRKNQLINEGISQTRGIIRETQRARASSLSRAAGSGSQFSSAFAGASASIQQQGDEQASTLFRNTTAGLRNFDINESILQAQIASQGVIAGLSKQQSRLKTQLNEVQANGANAIAKKQNDAAFGRSLFSLGGQIAGTAQQAAGVAKSLFTA